jgi:hypothetical protein
LVIVVFYYLESTRSLYRKNDLIIETKANEAEWLWKICLSELPQGFQASLAGKPWPN